MSDTDDNPQKPQVQNDTTAVFDWIQLIQNDLAKLSDKLHDSNATPESASAAVRELLHGFELVDEATPPAMKPADPHLAVGEFAERAKSIFVKIDSDGDGYLSESELDQASGNTQFQKEDLQAIAAMRAERSNLEELSSDEFGDEDDGITAADLNEFGRIEKAHNGEVDKAMEVLSWLENKENFAKLNTNGDKFLSESELAAAIKSDWLSEKETKIASYLQAKRTDLEEYSNDEWFDEDDGVTIKDMYTYVFEELAESDAAEIVDPVARAIFKTQQAQVQKR